MNFGCPIGSSEAWQIGLLGRAQEAAAAPGCPIAVEELAQVKALPQGGADQGEEPGEYYQWEQRALKALLSALEDQPTGRPKTPTDPEKEALQRRVQQLEQQVQQHQQRDQLRQLLSQWEQREDLPPAKKNPK